MSHNLTNVHESARLGGCWTIYHSSVLDFWQNIQEYNFQGWAKILKSGKSEPSKLNKSTHIRAHICAHMHAHTCAHTHTHTHTHTSFQFSMQQWGFALVYNTFVALKSCQRQASGTI